MKRLMITKSHVAILVLFMFLCTSGQLFAQQKSHKSVEISNENGKIRLKVTQEVDGEIKTFEKEYSSEDEMQNDPEYKEFFGEEPNFHWFGGNSHGFSFGDSDDMVFDFHKNFDSDFDSDQLRGFFKSFEDNGDNFFFQFDGDESFEDLQKRLQDMGKDVDVDFFEYNEDMEEALEEVRERLKDLSSEFDDFDINFHITPKNNQNGSKMIIIERKTLTISDIDSDDKEVSKYRKSNDLELDDLSYFPNPNDGRFTLRFRMPEQAPLSVAIFDLAGKEVYSESFSSFGGLFKEELNLSDQEPGVYLLEISSGKKKMTKKLLLE